MVLYYARIVIEMILNPIATIVVALFFAEFIKFSGKMKSEQKWSSGIIMVLMLIFVSTLPIPLWVRLVMASFTFVLNLLDIKYLPKEPGYLKINIAEVITSFILIAACSFLIAIN